MASLTLGSALGIVGGALFTALTYLGLLTIPQRYIFTVTSWLIALLAAGMAASAIQFVNNAGFADVLGDIVWDTSWLLPEGSIPGKLMHTLIGYTERPTGLQLAVYVGTLAVMAVLMQIARRPQPRAVAA